MFVCLPFHHPPVFPFGWFKEPPCRFNFGNKMYLQTVQTRPKFPHPKRSQARISNDSSQDSGKWPKTSSVGSGTSYSNYQPTRTKEPSPSLWKKPPRTPESEGWTWDGDAKFRTPVCLVCCCCRAMAPSIPNALTPCTRLDRAWLLLLFCHGPFVAEQRSEGKVLLRQTPDIWVPRLTRCVVSLLTGWVSRARPWTRTPHLRSRSATRSCPQAVQTQVYKVSEWLSQLSMVLPAC